MKRSIPLLLILLLASVLRIFQLGKNPPSLDWDEASLGYNAYSILKTGNDEYGNHLPFSIRSFNDYKPPLYTYTTIPFIAIFGLNEFSVRLSSAIAGTIAVLAIYFIAVEIEPKKHSLSLAQISSLLLAISPWHLQFSRGAFEANLALTCFLTSVAAFLKWKNNKKVFLLLISATFAVASLYAYHSTKIVVPVFFVVLGLVNYKTIFKNQNSFLFL
jgi:4-amino-4-deoxy-L-arabinose transferase-like glycosyltransferase